ncbi:MAG: alpha/beta hydrolase family protein [Candidatus Saccharibacteria bacterium]|nr:alpha/beta hydrolase family protein [Candidatus Saccharibacteria bacterium]
MKIVLDGQLVDYKDEGKGKLIVLLHGWGNDKKSLDSLAAHLAKHYRVIRIDFPGFGGSPKPKSDWYIGEYARFLTGFLKKLEIKNVYALAGHSFGGRVIIKSIAEQLINPEKVILMGAAGVKPKEALKKAIYKAIAKTGKAVTALPGLRGMRENLRRRLYASAGSMDYYNAAEMRTIFQHTIDEDLLPFVERITQPALLIWGEGDTETPVSQAHTMMAKLKHGELLVVEHAGHFVFNDQPGIVEKKIDEFLG